MTVKGVEPPLRTGHGNVIWIPLSLRDLKTLEERGKVRVAIDVGEETIVKTVRKGNVMNGYIAVYRRSTGEWALRDFGRDRKIRASHRPESIVVEVKGKRHRLTKGMTGDAPQRRKRRKARRKGRRKR